MLSVQEQQEILSWLEPSFPKETDPETLQNEKFSLQEENTCDWMVKSQWWKDWLRGSPSAPDPDGCWRFLWIHGLPGSGKTILASYLIDAVGRHCTAKGYSHYYCFHGHDRDETIPFLRWTIRDLTIQFNRCTEEVYIPKGLYNMWEYKKPTVEGLLDCLQEIAQNFFSRLSRRVYIVIDAVDESKMPRDRLLQVLTDIGTKPGFEPVSLLITSRDYTDIRNAILKLPRRPTPAAQPGQRATSSLSNPRREEHDLPIRGRDEVSRGTGEYMDNDDLKIVSTANLRRGLDHTPSPSRQKRQISGNQGARAPSPQKRKISAGGSYIDVGSDNNPEDDPIPDEIPCSILSMSNPFVIKAIETFIQQQLDKSYRFAQWPRPDFIDRMKIELAAKAGGMFRTVSCHLDMIERLDLTDEASILQEIKGMPMLIFKMYEKIITDGMSLLETGDRNRHNKEFARTALGLICSDTSEIPDAGVLVEAARLHVPQGIAQDYNFPKLERLLGCLAKVSRLRRKTPSLYKRDDDGSSGFRLHNKRFSVAHYTVKEYLYHEMTADGPAREFALSSEKTRILELTVMFYGLRNCSASLRPQGRNSTPTRFEEYCLKMTEKALGERAAIVVKHEDIWTAICPCLEWNAAHQNAIRNKATRDAFPNWARLGAAFEDDYTPKYRETSVLVSLLILQWDELAQVYLRTLTAEERDKVWKDKFALRDTDSKTVLQMCVSHRNIPFLKLFVSAGAMFQEEPDILFRALQDPYGDDETCNGQETSSILRILLERGAKPNPAGYKVTPLQLATRMLEPTWVQRLLMAGADPDAVGSPKGTGPPGFDGDHPWHKKPPIVLCNDGNIRPAWEQDDDHDGETAKLARRRVWQLLHQYRDFQQPGGDRKEGQSLIIEIADDD